MAPEAEYSVPYGRVVHYYQLANGQLTYQASDSDLQFCLELEPESIWVGTNRVFHRLWYGGLIGMLMPVSYFGARYFKERVIEIQGLDWLLVALFVICVLLTVWFRRPTKAYEVRTRKKDRLLIFVNPQQSEAAERFIAALKAHTCGST